MTAPAERDLTSPRDLSAAAEARRGAKKFIEEWMATHNGALPSGPQVGNKFGMTAKWGQNQLKPYRDSDASDDGTDDDAEDGTPERSQDTAGGLVPVRKELPQGSAPAPTVVAVARPERSPAPERPPAPQQPATRSVPRPTQRPEPPAAPSSERSAPATGTTSSAPKPGAGTPAAAANGTGQARATLSRKFAGLLPLLPLLVIAGGAFVSIWGGWVGLGKLTGFGEVDLLPGLVEGGWKVDTAITLPLGVEAYAAFAMKVWLAPPPRASEFTITFARRSAIGALFLGAGGQIAYHLMTAAGMTKAPWLITAFVATLPVVVLGLGAALAHLVRHPGGQP